MSLSKWDLFKKIKQAHHSSVYFTSSSLTPKKHTVVCHFICLSDALFLPKGPNILQAKSKNSSFFLILSSEERKLSDYIIYHPKINE